MQKVYNLQKKNFSSENFLYSSSYSSGAGAALPLRNDVYVCDAYAWRCPD